jgi:hypothetical protein
MEAESWSLRDFLWMSVGIELYDRLEEMLFALVITRHELGEYSTE